jgi:hypothetical protein
MALGEVPSFDLLETDLTKLLKKLESTNVKRI